MPLRFAVDLGTSNTVAVVDRGDGTPRPLLFDGSPVLPSAVFADVTGALLVGRDAERHMMTDAARFEPNPKGRIDEGVVLLGDRELPVAELLAAVLRRAAGEAAQTGVSIVDATVLTCPVDWGTTRRAVLLEAAARAGLGRVRLVDEPVSAATYCVRALGGRLAPGRCAVVFDFGGGTLDVTVVEATPGSLRVLATGGLADLGGTDIDDALVGHLGHLLAAADPALWQRLVSPRTPGEYRDRRTFWSEVRQAKEMLARTASAPVHVPGSDRALHLTREELDRVAGPLVDRAVDETRRVLQRSAITPAQLDAIVLVGGSSRLPLVASRLHARFGLAPVVPEQPELPVAFGALLLTAPTAPAPAGPPSRPPAADPTSGYMTAAPASGYLPAAAPALPVSAVPAPGPVSAPPVAAPPAAVAAPPAVAPPAAEPPRRPSVVIGPGVTIHGNVGIYGDGVPFPDDRDDDEPEPAIAPPPRKARRRSGFLRRARFALLPLLPFALMLVLTPWGRDLLREGFDAVGDPSPSASVSAPVSPAQGPSAPAAAQGATAKLDPAIAKPGTSVRLSVHGFGPREKVDVKAGTKSLTTVTTDETGSAETSVTPAAKGATAATVHIVLTGRTSNRTVSVAFVIQS
ncbi:Hsp70 family protein [Dactylosporangium sp. NPDC051541]|uniref:Hsp70 family protein n=1 Tax=Dactylosporangium sp. NPDC051541 TaxID=3363977 RepID=UPI00378AE3D7